MGVQKFNLDIKRLRFHSLVGAIDNGMFVFYNIDLEVILIPANATIIQDIIR